MSHVQAQVDKIIEEARKMTERKYESRPEVRGVIMNIGNDLLAAILEEALGMEPGKIEIVSAMTHGYNRATEIMVRGDSVQAFPVVAEGQRFPYATPIVTRHPDGKRQIERWDVERR